MKANEDILTKEIHFPLLRPLITNKDSGGVLSKTKGFLTYRRKFRLEEDWYIYSKTLRQYIFIPEGFVVDGASIPKALYSAYSSTGVLFYGSFPHDFGYRYSGLFIVDHNNDVVFTNFKKSILDDIFLELCSQESHMPIVSTIAKFALSLFGFTGWLSNRKLNNNIRDDYSLYFQEDDYC